MSGFDDDYDRIYDHDHDGHLDWWEQSEKDYNIEESVQWMKDHQSGSGVHPSGSYGGPSGSRNNTGNGCCYVFLIVIAIVVEISADRIAESNSISGLFMLKMPFRSKLSSSNSRNTSAAMGTVVVRPVPCRHGCSFVHKKAASR